MNQEKYINTLHKHGKRFMIVSSLLMLAVPFVFSLIHNAWPTLELIKVGFMTVGAIYIPIGIIETINYAPMLGVGATYISHVTGNISNMKLPASLSAMKQANVEPGSDEAEIISTLAVASSSIVTILIILVGVLLLLPYLSVIDQYLGTVTDYLVPAIFGALGFVFIVRHWKLVIIPMSVMLALFYFVIKDPTVQPVFVPVASLLSLVTARIMYKKGWIK
jgi:hypothetical protein